MYTVPMHSQTLHKLVVFVLFLLAIVLSVLRFTASGYPFDIFKLVVLHCLLHPFPPLSHNASNVIYLHISFVMCLNFDFLNQFGQNYYHKNTSRSFILNFLIRESIPSILTIFLNIYYKDVPSYVAEYLLCQLYTTTIQI